jgi:hypothetical protein
VKRLATRGALAIPPVRLTTLDLIDLDISVADDGMPDSKITGSQTKARNSCGIAMIRGAWTARSAEGGSNG